MQTNRQSFKPNLRKNSNNLAKTTRAIKRLREGPLKKLSANNSTLIGEDSWTLLKQSVG